MNTNIPYLICVSVLSWCCSFSLQAQTTNIGELTVIDGTQLSTLESFVNTASGSFVNDGEVFIYRDFINDGDVDYTSGGLTRFEDTAQQLIVSNEPSYFYNVLINNTSGLADAITISGIVNTQNQIDFSEGIVNTLNEDAQFILQDDGLVINTSHASFVDGFFTKEGDDSFEFPIGDSEFYRYAAISAPDNSDASYKARYVFQDPEDTYPAQFKIGNVELLNSEEYWAIENSSGSEDIEITLSWDEDSTTPPNIVSTPEEAIRMVRWDFEEEAWREVNSTITNTVNRTVSATQSIDGIAVFSIGRADLGIILPDGVIVWNAVSPNNDGDNDYLRIENVNGLLNNKVEIYNRWGTKLFETRNYDSNGNVFRGYAEGRDDTLLPSGTYFYVLTYDYADGTSTRRAEKAGYLYLSTD